MLMNATAYPFTFTFTFTFTFNQKGIVMMPFLFMATINGIQKYANNTNATSGNDGSSAKLLGHNLCCR